MKLGAPLTLTLTLLLGSCSSTPGTCWGLGEGNHLSLELVEAYTPTSLYTYERLPESLASTDFLDEYPSCGADFDYAAGDVLHTTITALGSEDPGSVCRPSEFRIDSPKRLLPTPARNAGAFLQGGRPVLYNGDYIVVDGCPTGRSITVISTGNYPGVRSNPVPGQLPPHILVRAAVVRSRLPDGSCDPGNDATKLDQYCGDAFVVRIKNE